MPDPPDKSSDPPSADTFGSWVRMRPDTHPKKKPSGKTPSPGRPGDTELSGVAPTGGELVAPPDTPRPPETPPPPDTSQGDQTIVSKGPPLTTEVAYAGLRPKDLGRALIGQQIGDMLLEEFIGGGGMGAVFRAKDQSLDRTVAVKVLAVHEESDADTHKRFEIEGRSAARLDHPNIARIHYVGSDRGLRYIVFEYIAGVNVRDLVVTNGVLPVADAVSFALQITSALTHAWERGVVHRDIKPSNILITRSGQAKLVDMGLARMRRVEQPVGELTTSGTTLGTFDYLAPEQARDPRDADTRSDIYSLGCTLYFMLTGRPPFPEGTAIQKLLQHQGDEPEGLASFRGDAPRSLGAIVTKMLAKKPADRPQTPPDLEAALIGVARQIGAMPALSLPGSIPFAPVKRREWSPTLMWLAPVAVLVVAGALLPRLWSTGDAGPAFEPIQAPAEATREAPSAMTAETNGEATIREPLVEPPNDAKLEPIPIDDDRLDEVVLPEAAAASDDGNKR